mmetsp:Transcript_7720/g.32808  ORF Transcript_7720/g.32808 Transcript_7720/m.32808 type:complete len:202 (-) Transcript_7720:335-940(-)
MFLRKRSCCRCRSTARAQSTTPTPSVSQARAISTAAAFPAPLPRSEPSRSGSRIGSATISTRPRFDLLFVVSFPASLSRAKSKSITGALAMNTPAARRENSRGAPTTSKTRKPSTKPSNALRSRISPARSTRFFSPSSSASPSATNDRTSASAMASIARVSDTARSFGNSTVRAIAANASLLLFSLKKKVGVPPDVDSRHS